MRKKLGFVVVSGSQHLSHPRLPEQQNVLHDIVELFQRPGGV